MNRGHVRFRSVTFVPVEPVLRVFLRDFNLVGTEERVSRASHCIGRCIGRCMDNREGNRSEQSPALEVKQCVCGVFGTHPRVRRKSYQ